MSDDLPAVPSIMDPEDGLICAACGRGHHGEPCPHVPGAVTQTEDDKLAGIIDVLRRAPGPLYVHVTPRDE